MITNTGKDILAKYLIGQAPSYASHIAFGCGAPKALGPGEPFGDYSNKQTLDFEMFRAPIVSRGYVKGIELDEFDQPVEVSQIVLTAELPTDERYEITELGVFSAGANPSASANDSKIVYTFANSENWQIHDASDGVSSIRFHSKPLDLLDTQTQPAEGLEGHINQPEKVFKANSDNSTLENQSRVVREERCRFLNNTIFMRGDTSAIVGSGDGMSVNPLDVSHIHLNGVTLNLDRNSASDEIRFAFSVVNKNPSSASPTDVKVILEFASADVAEGSSYEYARLKANVVPLSEDDPLPGQEQHDLSQNRYFVISKALEDLETSSGFSWNQVSIVKLYASIAGPNAEDVLVDYSDQFYLALDAVRFENTTTQNPLYGLTGYTVIKTTDGIPIIKEPNSANLVEFRFAMDVS